MNLYRPNFRDSVFGGYNKADVDEYLTEVKTQLDELTSQQETRDNRVQGLVRQCRTLNARLADAEKQNEALTTRNQMLTKTVESLSRQLDMMDEKLRKLRVSYQQAKDSAAAANAAAVQEALQKVQDMSNRVMGEAGRKAEQIRARAQDDAAAMIGQAQARTDAMQQEHDRILTDAATLKQELMEMYRRHLAVLATFPDTEGRLAAPQEVYLAPAEAAPEQGESAQTEPAEQE